jgi:hypothetical protein
MSYRSPITNKASYRAGFMQLAQQSTFTHWLTLNTHRDCSLATADKHLKRWRVEMLRRLHGQRFYESAPDQLTWYLGCPELSGAGHPHFHLALVIPESARPSFEAKFDYRWKHIVRSGTSHLVPIGPTLDDQRVVLGYASKWLDPGSDLPFVHSRVDW